MKVSIFGLGYVGCVTAACLARDGHEVTGVDVMASKVKRMDEGLPTVVETGIDEIFAEVKSQGRLRATTDGRAAVLETDVSIICVGTPNARDGSLDLSYIKATANLIGQAMMEKSERHVVILRSTVPAGTCENVVLPALHSDNPYSYLFDSDLVIVPEFLREGTAIADYYDPPFVVVGTASGLPDNNREVIQRLFGSVTDSIEWVPYREAEVLKAICNVFHALKVSFANEIGSFCHSVGVDGKTVMGLLVKDQKLNISPAYMRPGMAFGGSCLPKDLRMIVNLASRNAVDLPLLRSILPSNDAHLRRAIEMIPINGSRKIGLNGLAFKSGTDDLRESPIVIVAEHLIGKGYDLKIHDPAIEVSRLGGANQDFIEKHIPHLANRMVSTLDELIEHSEILLVTRDGDVISERAADLGRKPTIIDLRGKPAYVKKPMPMLENILQHPATKAMAILKQNGNGNGRGNGEHARKSANGRNGRRNSAVAA
ncbi:nucleotide sugar dehydrogenase [bacterium]|nr:nucleotide sugar dehydrogenase [bacterium]